MELADAKLYLRVDNTVDDALIFNLMSVAEDYIRGAVDDFDAKAANAAFAKKVEICQLAIIADLYENRNVAGKGTNDYSYIVRSLITQLQYTEVV